MKASPAQRILSIPDQVPGLITKEFVVIEYLAVDDMELYLAWFYDPETPIWDRIGLLETALGVQKARL